MVWFESKSRDFLYRRTIKLWRQGIPRLPDQPTVIARSPLADGRRSPVGIPSEQSQINSLGVRLAYACLRLPRPDKSGLASPTYVWRAMTALCELGLALTAIAYRNGVRARTLVPLSAVALTATMIQYSIFGKDIYVEYTSTFIS